MTHPTDDSLKPCPFCGAGTTEITPNGRMWTGMKYSEPSSVSVRHWCEAVPGQPSRMIERVGRDEASAIYAWNTRALLAEQARTEPTNLMGWIYEDSLPDAYPYHAMFPHSAVIDGVRMFPVYAPAQPLKAEQAKDAAEDAELLEWLEEKHYALHPIKEDQGDDTYTLWWQVTDKDKSISGHPLGNIRAAIRAARAAERKA